jgi:hypothetical protein
MEGPEPVFVDHTGRRSRLFKTIGFVGGTALVLATAGLLAGFTGAGAGVLPGLPGLGQTPGIARQPEASAHASPSPRAVTPTGTRRDTPGPETTPSVTGAVTGAQATASPSPTSRRNVPTQTPSHAKKK